MAMPERRTARPHAHGDDDPAFGVYIHWPFCLSKCPYCDFNSHVRHGGVDQPRFVRAFVAEIAATADYRRPNLFVNTPDILHAVLQHHGPGMFAIRAVLASKSIWWISQSAV